MRSRDCIIKRCMAVPWGAGSSSILRPRCTVRVQYFCWPDTPLRRLRRQCADNPERWIVSRNCSRRLLLFYWKQKCRVLIGIPNHLGITYAFLSKVYQLCCCSKVRLGIRLRPRDHLWYLYQNVAFDRGGGDVM